MPRFARRRGATNAALILGVIATLITLGVEMDSGRLFVSRHKIQVIADAATMAAAVKLPRETDSTAAANRIVTQYQATYNGTITSAVTYTRNASGLPTSVRVAVHEDVPMIFPRLMGHATRPVNVSATANRFIPAALLAGAVPIGIQYDSVFDIPDNGYASPNTVRLKQGSGQKILGPGNCAPLRFPGSNGGNDWGDFTKWGYTGRLAIGDWIDTEPGNKQGPTQNAIYDDVDSRFNRATAPPYNDDTWSAFDPGNPRIVVMPLVDWNNVNGMSQVQIKGFVAFWVESCSGGDIYGRFIRYSVSKSGGPGWQGVSIDPTTTTNYDKGLGSASMTQ